MEEPLQLSEPSGVSDDETVIPRDSVGDRGNSSGTSDNGSSYLAESEPSLASSLAEDQVRSDLVRQGSIAYGGMDVISTHAVPLRRFPPISIVKRISYIAPHRHFQRHRATTPAGLLLHTTVPLCG